MTKQRCERLRKQGHSIGSIARKLGLSKSTVHWHVKGIGLTASQREGLRRWKRRLMAQVNARRRGKAVKSIPLRKPVWSKALVHLIAHLSFDGRVDRYGCHYYSRSQIQTQHVRRLLQRLLGIDPQFRLRPNGIWVVSCYNVEVAAWLSERERALLRVVSARTTWQQQWLQAFFDDEGHIHVTRGIRRVRASQDDPRTLQAAQQFLNEMRISSRIDRRARALEITGQRHLLRFRDQVDFSTGLPINAARKNGLWKTAYEKRDLLDFALRSYRRPIAL